MARALRAVGSYVRNFRKAGAAIGGRNHTGELLVPRKLYVCSI
jgi:hypothetical protein